MSQRGISQKLIRIAFWAAALIVFVCAEMPANEVPHIVPWDKAEHFIAFYVLAVLGAAAFPRRALFSIGARLSVFGALIEIVQAIPALYRDYDFWDWVSDTIAIIAALTPIALIRWRAWTAGTAPVNHFGKTR